MANEGDDRGRRADRPLQIPAKGWRDIALRVKGEIGRDNLTIVAAGVAFYAMLALFPALAALVSIYGLAFDPADVKSQVGELAVMMPSQVAEVIGGQLHELVTATGAGLTLGFLTSLVLALWTASSGMNALIQGINITYDERETRGFLKVRGLALLLTLGATIMLVVLLAGVVLAPTIAEKVGLGGAMQTLIAWGRWPVLAGAFLVGLSVLYRYAPARRKARWEWVTWGSVLATVLWLGGSALFSLYVEHMGKFNETYGSLGTIVVLLLWLFVSAFAILLGGELNAEMEHQTAQDTTERPEKPMGQRRAYVADTLGESPAKS